MATTDKQKTTKPEAVSDEQPNVPQLAIHNIFGVLGIAFMLSWGLCVFISPLLFKTLSLSMQPIVVKEIFIAASLVMALIIMLLSYVKVLRVSTVPLFRLLAICSPVAPILDFLGANSSLILIFWIVSGLGNIIILILWGSYITKLDHQKSVLYPALSFAFMGLLMIIVGLFDDTAATITIILFPLLSVLMVYLERYTRSSNRVSANREEYLNPVRKSFPRKSALFRSVLGTLRSSLYFGFAIQYFFILTTYNALFFFGLVIIAACLVRILDYIKKDSINMDVLGRILMPAAALTLLPLSFADAYITFFLCCLILAYSALSNMTSMSAVGENARINRIKTLLIFNTDRLGNLIGLGVGMFLSFLAFNGEPVEAATGSFVPYLLVIILACLHPIIFSGSNSYQFTISDLQGQADAPNQKDHRGLWKNRCLKFAEHYRLSPRQQEVMLLLAKGRDTIYIEETLAISGHTAKAHIYNIYSKTNVHSRQELINLIESFDVPGQDG